MGCLESSLVARASGSDTTHNIHGLMLSHEFKQSVCMSSVSENGMPAESLHDKPPVSSNSFARYLIRRDNNAKHQTTQNGRSVAPDQQVQAQQQHKKQRENGCDPHVRGGGGESDSKARGRPPGAGGVDGSDVRCRERR